MQIEQMPVVDLRPHERNSRTHSPAQVEQFTGCKAELATA